MALRSDDSETLKVLAGFIRDQLKKKIKANIAAEDTYDQLTRRLDDLVCGHHEEVFILTIESLRTRIGEMDINYPSDGITSSKLSCTIGVTFEEICTFEAASAAGEDDNSECIVAMAESLLPNRSASSYTTEDHSTSDPQVPRQVRHAVAVTGTEDLPATEDALSDRGITFANGLCLSRNVWKKREEEKLLQAHRVTLKVLKKDQGLPSQSASANSKPTSSSAWLCHDSLPDYDEELTFTVVTSTSQMRELLSQNVSNDSVLGLVCSILEWCSHQLECDHGLHEDAVHHPSILIFIAERKAKASKKDLWALKTASGREVSKIFKECRDTFRDSNEGGTNEIDFLKLVVECMQASPGSKWKKDALDRFAEKTHEAPEKLDDLDEYKKGCLVMSPSSGKVLGVGMTFAGETERTLQMDAWHAADKLPKTDKWSLVEMSEDGLRFYYPLMVDGQYRLKAWILPRKYPGVVALAHAVGADGESAKRLAVMMIRRFLYKDDGTERCLHSIPKCCGLWQQLVKDRVIDNKLMELIKGLVECDTIRSFDACVSEEACEEASSHILALHVGKSGLVTLARKEERRELMSEEFLNILGKHPSAASMPWRVLQRRATDGMVTVEPLEPLEGEGDEDQQLRVELPETVVDCISHFALVAEPPRTEDGEMQLRFTDPWGDNERMVLLTRKTWTKMLEDCNIEVFKLTVVPDTACANEGRSASN